MKLFSHIGGAPCEEHTQKMIRLILKGCVNRPFFHISIQEVSKTPQEQVIEQIGNYDPLPNNHNEKVVAINFQRLEYWLRKGAQPTEPVQKLLGLCGYFPVHPNSFIDAYLRRKEIISELEKLKIEAAKFSDVKSDETRESTKVESSSSSVSVEEESTSESSSSSSNASTEEESSSSSSSSTSADESTNTVTEELKSDVTSEDKPSEK